MPSKLFPMLSLGVGLARFGWMTFVVMAMRQILVSAIFWAGEHTTADIMRMQESVAMVRKSRCGL